MKKGFTLVELLAVVVILGITSTIVFPAIGNIISNSKRDLYNSQVLDIEAAAEKWATNNLNLMDQYHVNDIYISLESLRYSDFLEKDEIKNPIDRTIMDGCVKIKYDDEYDKYTYIYDEKTCKTYASDSEAYIIYEYDIPSKTFIKSDASKEKRSAGLQIVEEYSLQNLIRYPGSTDSGLYDMDDEYVFKGSEVNNYVTFANSTWRILSISKKDYSLKLIKNSVLASNAWDTKGSINFESSTINNKLIENINDEDGTAFGNKKIVSYDYQIGNVMNGEFSINALKSELSKKTTTKTDSSDTSLTTAVTNTANQKVGTISVLDYVNASATSQCVYNYMSNKCSENNYLYNMFGSSNTTWTLNGDGSQIWYINTDGTLALTTPAEHKQIYAVVKLLSNIYISDNLNTGTQENPYTLK